MLIWEEFKTFAMRGSVVDLAIGVIIGAAFSKVVSALVSDVLMPPIGIIVGGVDFSDLSIILKKASEKTPPVEIKYGAFFSTLIDFFIVALVIFTVVKIMNKLRGDDSTIEPKTKDCPECLMTIPYKAKRCGHCCTKL